MSLKIEHLKETLQAAEAEARAWNKLKEELKAILGPTFDTTQRFKVIVEDANQRLDAFEKKDRFVNGSISEDLIETFMGHPNYNVRKLVARFAAVGSSTQKKFLHDSSPAVRFTSARTATVSMLSEATKLFPHDDNLQSVLRQKTLNENAIWKHNEYSFAMPAHDEKPSKAVKNPAAVSELSNAFYETLALKFLSDYGTNLEYTWEEVLVKRYCSSVRATSLVEIDAKKLYETIIKKINEKEQRALDLQRVSLREVAERLRESEFDGYDESPDAREELLNFAGSDREFMLKVESVYSMLNSNIPPGIKKYRLAEGNKGEVKIPMKASVPNGTSVSLVDEKVLDKYVETWNRVQSLQGEPLKLDWHHDAIDASKVSFSVVLK